MSHFTHHISTSCQGITKVNTIYRFCTMNFYTNFQAIPPKDRPIDRHCYPQSHSASMDKKKYNRTIKALETYKTLLIAIIRVVSRIQSLPREEELISEMIFCCAWLEQNPAYVWLLMAHGCRPLTEISPCSRWDELGGKAWTLLGRCRNYEHNQHCV